MTCTSGTPPTQYPKPKGLTLCSASLEISMTLFGTWDYPVTGAPSGWGALKSLQVLFFPYLTHDPTQSIVQMLFRILRLIQGAPWVGQVQESSTASGLLMQVSQEFPFKDCVRFDCQDNIKYILICRDVGDSN